MEGLISRNFTVFFMSFSPSDILRTHNYLFSSSLDKVNR